ncbi:hypothetical protein LNKW23_44100 [Paralimibaculum aggregatum]|uniref:Transposase DDE domain-containing protein n=1 Tax=Paralimibaculum aggregatum TaxID=3036245 RepID=A0ABQ6LSY1_9RHOB|nr:hypothetical protein LNKW23_44100 [Limibaculum sp. NKW23]
MGLEWGATEGRTGPPGGVGGDPSGDAGARPGAGPAGAEIAARFPLVERVFADAGYLGPPVAGAVPRPLDIARRSNPGFVVQARRWIVERSFAWIAIERRLARAIARIAATVRTMTNLMPRRLARSRIL